MENQYLIRVAENSPWVLLGRIIMSQNLSQATSVYLSSVPRIYFLQAEEHQDGDDTFKTKQMGSWILLKLLNSDFHHSNNGLSRNLPILCFRLERHHAKSTKKTIFRKTHHLHEVFLGVFPHPTTKLSPSFSTSHGNIWLSPSPTSKWAFPAPFPTSPGDS